MPTASSLAWKTSLRKVRTLWHCSRLRSVALYLWLIVVISVRHPTVVQYLGSLPGALVMCQFEHKADSSIAKFKEAGGTVREIDVWAEPPRLFCSAICIIVRLSWAVNHYRDNAITYKAGSDKMPENWSCMNAAITDMQMRQRDAVMPGMQIHEGVSWC